MSTPRGPLPHSDTCATCRFFCDEGDGRQGDCRRKPPVMLVIPVPRPPQVQEGVDRILAAMPQVITAFPKVARDAWCGEWQMRSVPRGDA